MASRYYSSVAAVTTLSNGVSPSGTSFIVGSTSGFPVQTPFTLLIDEGTQSEEIVSVTNVAGTTLTVTRGEDGTVAVAHDPGARVRHAMTARDLRESREHEDKTTGVHGITDASKLVTTDGTQTLTGKTINNAILTGTTKPTSSSVAGPSPLLITFTDGAEWPDADNKPFVEVTPRGGLRVRGGQAVRTGATFDSAALEVRGQSANLERGKIASFKNAMNTEVASIDKDGNATFAGLTVAGQTASFGAWQPFTPSWTVPGGTNPSIGNGSISAAYSKVGKTVHFRITITMGSTTTYGSGSWVVSLPEPFASGDREVFNGIAWDASPGQRHGLLFARSGNLLGIYTASSPASTVNPTTPMTWAVNDYFSVSGTYECA